MPHVAKKSTTDVGVKMNCTKTNFDQVVLGYYVWGPNKSLNRDYLLSGATFIRPPHTTPEQEGEDELNVWCLVNETPSEDVL